MLTPGILSVLLVPPEKMSLWTLFSYVQHLRENRQESARYEIALWNKVIYPFAVLVMMVLALPFAYMNVQGRRSQHEDLRRHHAGPGLPSAQPPVRPRRSTGCMAADDGCLAADRSLSLASGACS